MSIKTKAFLEVILNHASDPQKVKKMIIDDHRLTRDEKKIVNCFLLMRRNKNREGLNIAEDISKQQDPFVESMRCFILAGLLNNLNQHQNSLKYFQSSYASLPKNKLSHFEFVIVLNMFQLSVNLRNLKHAHHMLENMEQIKNLNAEDYLTLKKCWFNYFTLSEDLEEATNYLKIMSENLDQFKDHTRSVLLLDMWDYGIVFGKYQICVDVLEMMKEQKTYILSQNYNYMKILLTHFLDGQPIYVVENEFKEYPDLLMQLKVIRALECNRISEAKAIWETLSRIKPHVFNKEFKVLGQKTIFCCCLSKYQGKINAEKPRLIRDKKLSITESIEQILLMNDEISKEDLFSFLYGREAENKDDFNRLSRDIYKFKTSKRQQIDSKKGKYSLIKKVS